jgi:inosose dehydratase
MTIRFGVSPIAWMNDDLPELGGETSVETVLSDVAEIGFSGIELGGRFPRRAAQLAPLLARYRLDLIGGWWSMRLLTRSATAEIAAMQRHLDLLEALGAPVFIAAECSNAIHGDRTRPLADGPRLRARDWPLFGERVNAVAAHVETHGLKFAYHSHLGTVVERAEDLEHFLNHTAAHVGLVADTGHLALGGLDALSLIRRQPGRIAHVHAKDVRGQVFERILRQRGSFLDGVVAGMFTAPGDGDLDFGPLMRALADTAYEGWIVIEAEQDPKMADPRTYSRLGLGTLKEAAGAAGMIPAAAAAE